tara:strand:- start:71 stop:463 length:393 start_codon:yes stop_codon:yes gene_type:complete
MRKILLNNLYWTGCGNEDKLYGFLRLRLSKTSGFSLKSNSYIDKDLADSALLRELHVYGKVIPTYIDKSKKSSQHLGFGTKLVNAAIELSIFNGFKKIAVISGDGVRNYYRNKFGFNITSKNGYLLKYLY